MFRITPLVCNSRNILYRCRSIEIRVARISQTSARAQREREACPTPPPPPPPPRDLRLLWGTLALGVFTGYFTVYAKKSPEVRDWLSIHLPWFDDFIAIVYEENMSYADFAKDMAARAQDYVTRDRRPRQCSSDGKPVPPSPPKSKEEDVRCVTRDEKPVKPGDKDACTVQQPPFVIKNICEMETCLRDQGTDAVNNYWTAREACRYYNELVEGTMFDFNLQRLKALRPAMAERLDLVKRHVANAEKFTNNLEEMTRFLDCGMGATKEAIDNTKTLLKEYQAKIKAMEMEYLWQNDESLVMDDRWMKVEELIDQYIHENEELFPTVKYNSAKPFIQDDVDLLLHHTLRYKNKLQATLDEVVAGMTERVDRGIETLSQEDKDKKDRDALIQATFRKRQGELDKLYKKRHDDLRAANDKMIKDALKKQLDRHEENMRQKLKQKEEEAGDRINKMVADAVAAEKKNFARDLEQMAIKLRIVETKLNERLKAEREARRSQELWTAGASLLAATKKGAPLIKVNKELTALEKAAGENDKLVQTVLKSIPATVREEGVVPESVLRERYHRMEKAALKVALVEQEGAPLPVYMISWLQATMLFLKLSGIPQKDIDKPIRENVEDLDTFDKLQRARYWVERGNIAAALRYVSSLQGASRLAAETWHRDAQSYLEIRQAAEAVLAHAAALGLQYI